MYEKVDIIELVKLARTGCDMASYELYRRLWSKLKRMCISYYIPEADHEDLMNDVYVKVFVKIDGIEPERFVSYITTAMRNRLINYISILDREWIKSKIISRDFFIDTDDDETNVIVDLINADPPAPA